MKDLQDDTRNTLLENSLQRFDGTECSQILPNSGCGGNVSCLMILRLNRARTGFEQYEVENIQQTRVNYYRTRLEENPFSDPSLLDTYGCSQSEAVQKAVT